MIDPFTAWSRLMAAAGDAARTGRNMSETLAASGEVVAERTAMIGTAMRSPLDGDYAELGRMIPEKIEAFAKAGSAIATEWWAMHTTFLIEAQHLGGMAMRGRPPTAAEMATLASRNMTHALRTVERTVALGTGAVAPVHAKATANARRLRRAKKRRPTAS